MKPIEAIEILKQFRTYGNDYLSAPYQQKEFEEALEIARKALDLLEEPGVKFVIEERQRQVNVEGWTPEHDAEHIDDSIACAAACYAFPQRHRPMNGYFPYGWKWDKSWWKPTPDNRIKELAKAGALIIAEIARLLALEETNKDKQL